MLSSLCSLSHFILTLRCVWWSLCMCVSDRLLCPLSPLPCGCALLCSGRNDGFCASQSSSQQDTHIKGSFSGQPCRVSMCRCLWVRVCLCVILSTSFSGVHADCASYCARVQTIKVPSVSLPLSFLHTLPLFSIYLSLPLFLLPIWNLCRPQTTSLNFCCTYQLLNFTRGASPIHYCKWKHPRFRKQQFLLEKLQTLQPKHGL